MQEKVRDEDDSLLVVKVGTDIACSDKARRGVGKDVQCLRKAGTHVVLVSSGAKAAAGAGRFAAGTEEWRDAVRSGQEAVHRGWRRPLAPHAVAARLILGKRLMDDDMRSIVDALARERIPLINEDDTADPEMLLGNNDQLSAATALRLAETGLFNKIGFVIATNVAGLCEKPDDATTLITEVDARNPSRYEQLAGGASGDGTGGLSTKFWACVAAARQGIPACIVDGRQPEPLIAGLHRRSGTYFPPP